MNEALKAAIDEAFDLEQLVKDGVSKNLTGTLSDLIKAGTDLPKLISQAQGLQTELQALMASPSADADLLAYIQGKVGGESAKVQGVLVACCDLLLSMAQVEPKAMALVAALKV